MMLFSIVLMPQIFCEYSSEFNNSNPYAVSKSCVELFSVQNGRYFSQYLLDFQP